MLCTVELRIDKFYSVGACFSCDCYCYVLWLLLILRIVSAHWKGGNRKRSKLSTNADQKSLDSVFIGIC